jgi:hypothetical protein
VGVPTAILNQEKEVRRLHRLHAIERTAGESTTKRLALPVATKLSIPLPIAQEPPATTAAEMMGTGEEGTKTLHTRPTASKTMAIIAGIRPPASNPGPQGLPRLPRLLPSKCSGPVYIVWKGEKKLDNFFGFFSLIFFSSRSNSYAEYLSIDAWQPAVKVNLSMDFWNWIKLNWIWIVIAGRTDVLWNFPRIQPQRSICECSRLPAWCTHP